MISFFISANKQIEKVMIKNLITSSLMMPYLLSDSALDFDSLDKIDLDAARLEPSFLIGFVSPAL